MNATRSAVEAARRMLAPGNSCILDCETTDLEGAIVEVAVIAADTGDVLFDELVDPNGVPISDSARRVHGISAEHLIGARRWAQVYPDLLAAIGNRRIAAYNAAFDRGRIMHDCNRIGIDAGPISDLARWACIMDLRTAAHGQVDRMRLDGGHRALSDVRVARDLLLQIADGNAA